MKKVIRIQSSESNQTVPVAQLVSLANRYNCSIYFEKDSRRINAKSIMGMMSLVLNEEKDITVDAEGNDAKDAIEALEEFLAR